MPHILSVADLATTQDRTRQLLEGAAYRVSTAGTAEEAVARYRAHHPDGVLIEVSGISAKPVPILQALRSADAQARVAIVHPGDADDREALSAEGAATELLLKPFDPTRWLRAVAALVHPRSARQYVRVRTALPAQLAAGNVHAVPEPCTIEDLTPEGARCRCLQAHAGLQPGAVISLAVDLPQGSIHAIARIVHRSEQAAIGVRFLRLAPEAHVRLGAYYEELLSRQGGGDHGAAALKRVVAQR